MAFVLRSDALLTTTLYVEEKTGPPVFNIKVGRPVKCLAHRHYKRTCRLVLNLLLSTYHAILFGGVLRPLKNLEIRKRKIYYYRLKFRQMMPQNSSFQTVLMIKGLVLWQRCNLNLILAQLAIAENLAGFVVCNWALGVFNPFWVKKFKN